MMQLSLLDLPPEPAPTLPATSNQSPEASNQVLQVWRCTDGAWHYTGQMGFEHALTLRPGDVALPVGEIPAPPMAPTFPVESGFQVARHKILFQMHWQKEIRTVPVTGLLYCPSLLFWLMAIAATELANCHQCQWFLTFTLNQSNANSFQGIQTPPSPTAAL